MDSKIYRDFLLSSIKPSKIASGGSHVNCRCFYCPDGRSPNSKHFYISIPQDDKTPSLYYCHKCHSSGVVSYKTLIEWGIYDNKIGEELVYHNRNCSKYSNNNNYFDDHMYNIFVNNIPDQNTNTKIEYLNNRLGYTFTLDELNQLKIVLNLKDIFSNNYIQEFTRDHNIIDQLNNNFLGFLSIDNAFLNMRRLCNEGLVYKSIDKRYINYSIFNKFNTAQRFYTIPCNINITSPERLKIHIAEGPFDILSIYLNLRHREEGIYTSIAGSNYIGQIIYFISRFKLPYNEFHIYPDNDKHGSRWNMMKIANFLKPLGIPLYIHRNTYSNEKDFGVSPDRIIETVERIN